MPDQRAVTDQDRDQVRALHAQGLSRNAIAKQLGRSGRTVSRIAVELGLSFERGPQVAAATEARKVDAKARRAALAVALLDDAERLRAQLWQPHLYWEWGGRDHTYDEKLADEPTPTDKLKLMQATGTAIDRAVRLDEYDAGTGLGQVVSLLDKLGQGLAVKYGSGDDEHPVDADADG